MGADFGGEARLSGAALDHLQRTQARHRPILERIAPPGLAAAEERSAAIIADAGGLEVGVDVGLRGVVGGDDVVAPTRLVEAQERAGALGVVVGDAKRDGGAHAREAVDEHAEQRAVAKTCERRGIDAVEKRPAPHRPSLAVPCGLHRRHAAPASPFPAGTMSTPWETGFSGFIRVFLSRMRGTLFRSPAVDIVNTRLDFWDQPGSGGIGPLVSDQVFGSRWRTRVSTMKRLSSPEAPRKGRAGMLRSGSPKWWVAA